MSNENIPDGSSRNDDLAKTKIGQKNSRRITKPAVFASALALGIIAALAASQAFSAMAPLKTYASTAGTSAATTGTSNATSSPQYFHGNYSVSPPTVSTSGSSSTKVQPDKFSVTVAVQTNGTTAQEASSRNADLMAQVISALKALGISSNQLSTTNYSVSPVYSYETSKLCPQPYGAPYCPPSQVITGYTTSNSVTVTLDTAGPIDAGKVIDTSVQAGANSVYGVDFFVSQSKQQAIKDSLTQDAIANARHRADIAADALGMKISGVQSVNLNDVYIPVYSMRYDAAVDGASTQTPIQPGQQDVSATVSVVFYFMGANGSGANQTSALGPIGMTRSLNNPDCVNPPGGPMIC